MPSSASRPSSPALIGVLVFALLRFASAARECQHAPAREQDRDRVRDRRAARRAHEAEGAGARDVGARRSIRAAQQRDRREPVFGAARRRAATGTLRILNPAGRRLLNRDGVGDWASQYRKVLPAALAQVIDECLHDRQPIVRRTLQVSCCRPGAGVSRRQRFAAFERPGTAARRDLPVHGSDAGRRNGGAAAVEGEPRAGRRADRRHRPRVPQRSGDDSWIRAAARSQCAAALVSSAYPGHPSGDRGARRGGDEFPELRKARSNDALAGRPPRDRRACRRRSAQRGAGAWRRRGRAGRISRHRGGRRAAAAGVQQPVEECRRGVRRCVDDAARSSSMAGSSPAACACPSTTTARASLLPIASACSGLSSRRRAAEQASVWRSCRRSS